MFRIRQEQLDVLQSLANARTSNHLRAELERRGVSVEHEPSTGDTLIADKRGYQTRLRYDSEGLLRELRRPSGQSERYSYDSHGRLNAIDHAGGERWQYAYNDLDLISRFEIVGHARYKFDYTDQGWLRAVTYPDDRIESFERNSLGELIRRIHRSGAVTQTSVSHAAGRLTDALGRTVEYRLDGSGMLDRVDFPDGSSEQFLFDPESRQAVITQRSGRPVLCQLDDLGRPSSLVWDDGSQLRLKQDGLGRLIAAENGDDEVAFVYNDDGHLKQETSRVGVVAHDYDPSGRLISTVTHQGEVVRYEYDGDGLLATIHDWEGRRISIRNSPHGLPAQIAYPNGVVESWTIGGEPVQIETTLAGRTGKVLSRLQFEFDNCDRVRSVLDQWGTKSTEQCSRQFDYDDEFRVTSEVDLQSNQRLTQFAYDPVGNMVQDGSTAVEFGPMDNIIARASQPICYDTLGNITSFNGSRGPVGLAFSADSRLQSATVGERRIKYTYDGLCRRTGKTDGVETWRFGWSGFQLLWEEYYPRPGAEPVRRDYLYLPGCVVPLAFREAGRTFWIQSDPRGAVVAVHDEGGLVVWRGIYDSFGEVKVVVNKIRQPWRFSGQYLDVETGLHYNIVRYYSPELKTYVSLDPRWQEADGSKYSYCRNDPWNRADPVGTLGPLAIGAIAVGAAGLISGAIAAYNAPKGEGLSAFGKGFAVGAGAALAGIGVALALPSIGVAATAMAGLAIIGGVEGAVASALDDVINGRPICWSCMAASAGFGAVLGIVLPAVGGFLGRKVLNKFGPKLKPFFDKVFKRGKTPKRGVSQPPLRGCNAAEMDLAAAAGSSPSQIAARRKVAEAFYRENTNWPNAKIEAHMKGIDFAKPVTARVTSAPENGVQWQVPGGPKGNYLGKPGAKPSELGIGPLGLEPGKAPRRVVEKVPTTHTIPQGTPILESTAKGVKDTWSIPGGGEAGKPGTLGYSGIKQQASGGGTQIFVP